jgi:hypothetical protein
MLPTVCDGPAVSKSVQHASTSVRCRFGRIRCRAVGWQPEVGPVQPPGHCCIWRSPPSASSTRRAPAFFQVDWSVT